MRSRAKQSVLAGGLILAAAPWAGAARACPERVAAFPAFTSASNYFGSAVALDGDWLIAGDPVTPGAGIFDPNFGFGAVYLFERTGPETWEHRSELIDPNRFRFGFAVALDGDSALVSDLGTPQQPGRVTTLQCIAGVWTPGQRLTPPGLTRADGFGLAVDLLGDRFVATAAENAAVGPDAGAAYVYACNGGTWALDQPVTPGTLRAHDRMTAVDLDADQLILGARGDLLDPNVGPGRAFVFQREAGGGWVEEAELAPPGGAPGMLFGAAVAIAGDLALVGAPADDGDDVNAGAVYAFERVGGSWQFHSRFVAGDIAATDRFGAAVTLDGTVAAVGAPGKKLDGRPAPVGAAYLFLLEGGTWRERAVRRRDAGSTAQDFGTALGLADGALAIGGPGNRGAVFVDAVALSCAGDVDGDGAVALDDLLILLGGYGGSGPGDLDCSGAVELDDLLELLGAFGGACR